MNNSKIENIIINIIGLSVEGLFYVRKGIDSAREQLSKLNDYLINKWKQ